MRVLPCGIEDRKVWILGLAAAAVLLVVGGWVLSSERGGTHTGASVGPRAFASPSVATPSTLELAAELPERERRAREADRYWDLANLRSNYKGARHFGQDTSEILKRAEDEGFTREEVTQPEKQKVPGARGTPEDEAKRWETARVFVRADPNGDEGFFSKCELINEGYSEDIAQFLREAVERETHPDRLKDLYLVLGSNPLESTRRFLMERLGREKDVIVRQWISAALTNLGRAMERYGVPDASRYVEAYRKAGTEEERLAALQVLMSGSLPALPQVKAILWEVVDGHPDDLTRAQVMLGLRRAHLEEAELRRLIARAQDPDRPLERDSAYLTLLAFLDREVVLDFFLGILESDADVQEKLTAGEHMIWEVESAGVGNGDLRRRIQTLAETAPEEEVRRWAADRFQCIEEERLRNAARNQDWTKNLDRLTAAAILDVAEREDLEATTRARAIEELGKRSRELGRELDRLRWLASEDDEEEVRAAAVRVLGAAGHEVGPEWIGRGNRDRIRDLLERWKGAGQEYRERYLERPLRESRIYLEADLMEELRALVERDPPRSVARFHGDRFLRTMESEARYHQRQSERFPGK